MKIISRDNPEIFFLLELHGDDETGFIFPPRDLAKYREICKRTKDYEKMTILAEQVKYHQSRIEEMRKAIRLRIFLKYLAWGSVAAIFISFTVLSLVSRNYQAEIDYQAHLAKEKDEKIRVEYNSFIYRMLHPKYMLNQDELERMYKKTRKERIGGERDK